MHEHYKLGQNQRINRRSTSMSEEKYEFSVIQKKIALLATAAGCGAGMITIDDFPNRFNKSNPVGLVIEGHEDHRIVIHMDGIVEFVPSGEKSEDTDDWIIHLAELIEAQRLQGETA